MSPKKHKKLPPASDKLIQELMIQLNKERKEYEVKQESLTRDLEEFTRKQEKLYFMLQASQTEDQSNDEDEQSQSENDSADSPVLSENKKSRVIDDSDDGTKECAPSPSQIKDSSEESEDGGHNDSNIKECTPSPSKESDSVSKNDVVPSPEESTPSPSKESDSVSKNDVVPSPEVSVPSPEESFPSPEEGVINCDGGGRKTPPVNEKQSVHPNKSSSESSESESTTNSDSDSDSDSFSESESKNEKEKDSGYGNIKPDNVGEITIEPKDNSPFSDISSDGEIKDNLSDREIIEINSEEINKSPPTSSSYHCQSSDPSHDSITFSTNSNHIPDQGEDLPKKKDAGINFPAEKRKRIETPDNDGYTTDLDEPELQLNDCNLLDSEVQSLSRQFKLLSGSKEKPHSFHALRLTTLSKLNKNQSGLEKNLLLSIHNFLKEIFSQLNNLQLEHLKQFNKQIEKQVKLSLDVLIHNFSTLELEAIDASDKNVANILHSHVNAYCGMKNKKPKPKPKSKPKPAFKKKKKSVEL